MEGEAINLENNGNCLFCKFPPAPANPVAFYSVRALLQYLQINEFEVKAESGEGEQAVQAVDLEGSEVNAALCKECGDLAKRFLELKAMLEMSMESCLVSIQMKMEVGNKDGMEYPVREGIIMRKALQILKMTQPRIYSQNLQVSEGSSALSNVPCEVVKIEEEKEDAIETTQDTDSVPIISEIVKIEIPVPPDEHHDTRGEAEGEKERQRKTPTKGRRQTGQKRAIGKGQQKDAKQVMKARDNDKVVGGEVKGHSNLKQFQRSKSISRQVRKRIHNRPYKCLKCFKTFLRMEDLISHLGSHSVVRPLLLFSLWK